MTWLDDRRAVSLMAALFFFLWLLYGVPLQNLAYDPSFYYAHVRSPLLDGDLDFSNEGQPEELVRFRTSTGLVASLWSCGPAIAWLPFFLTAHLITLAGGAPTDGYSSLYLTMTALGSAIWGMAGVFGCYALARRVAMPLPALAATIGIWLASPLFFFMYRIPLYAHAPTVALAAAILLVWSFGRERTDSYWMWLLLGLLIGLAATMRWQNGLYVLIVPFALRRMAWRDIAIRLSLAAIGIVIGFAPQLMVWWRLYHQFIALPQGSDFLRWWNPVIRPLLFGTNRGLFVWQPITMLGMAGLALLAWRDRRLGLALGIVIGLELYLNSIVRDWWGGGGYGPRRFDWLLPPLALGAAGAFTAIWRNRGARITSLAAIAVLVFHQLGLAQAYYYRILPGGTPFPIDDYDNGRVLSWSLFTDVFTGTLAHPAFLVLTGASVWSSVPPLLPGIVQGRLAGADLRASVIAAALALALIMLIMRILRLKPSDVRFERVFRNSSLAIIAVSSFMTALFLGVGP